MTHLQDLPNEHKCLLMLNIESENLQGPKISRNELSQAAGFIKRNVVTKLQNQMTFGKCYFYNNIVSTMVIKTT